MVNCSSGGTIAGLFFRDADEFSRFQKLFFSGGDGWKGKAMFSFIQSPTGGVGATYRKINPAIVHHCTFDRKSANAVRREESLGA
jgi:hypothetical protein